MATLRKVQVTFDCADPELLARFWCEVLGYELEEGLENASDPTGVGPRLYFQKVPEGKVVKNRVHLDVRVGTGLRGAERLAALQAEQARLEALGATHFATLLADEVNESTIVMQDPEGNEFCLD